LLQTVMVALFNWTKFHASVCRLHWLVL